MQKAELQKNADSKRAEADAAYEIQKEEQRKTIEVTAANANIAKEERLVLLKQREAETMEKSLDAQVKKKRKRRNSNVSRKRKQSCLNARKKRKQRNLKRKSCRGAACEGGSRSVL